MSTSAEISVRATGQRRHGTDLEQSILNAAWEQLEQSGFAKFTYEAVAARAGTSRSVLYRRWPTKQDLIEATIIHRRMVLRPAPPDTGTLRGDLMVLMTANAEAMTALATVVAVRLAGYFADRQITLADIRERVLAESDGSNFSTVYLRAQQRGEVDLTGLPPHVLSLPADLLRSHLLLTFGTPPTRQVERILDDIFFPLLRAWGAWPSEPGPRGRPAADS